MSWRLYFSLLMSHGRGSKYPRIFWSVSGFGCEGSSYDRPCCTDPYAHTQDSHPLPVLHASFPLAPVFLPHPLAHSFPQYAVCYAAPGSVPFSSVAFPCTRLSRFPILIFRRRHSDVGYNSARTCCCCSRNFTFHYCNHFSYPLFLAITLSFIIRYIYAL